MMVSELGVDALVHAGLIRKEDYPLAAEIVAEEIFVRLVGGERPTPAPAWIFIEGWNIGFNKVRCTELIHENSNLELADSRRITDAVLEGRRQLVELETAAKAKYLASELEKIGAKVELGAP